MAIKFNPDSYKEDRLNLQNEYDTKMDQLQSSPTAFSTSGAGAAPTVEDLKANSSLIGLKNKIESLDSANQKARWYGTQMGQGETAKKEGTGFISKVFDIYNKPLEWEVGALKWLTGTTDKKNQNLFKAMDYNADVSKDLYGDVLKKAGIPSPIANIAGLYLDITLDPIDMVTFGLGSLVPRAAYGLYKGVKTSGKVTDGLSLAKSGIVSHLGKDFLWLENLMPGMAKATKQVAKAQKIIDNPAKYTPIVVKNATKMMEEGNGLLFNYKNKIAKFAKKVGQEDKLFNAGVGYNPLSRVGRTIAAPIEDALRVREPLNVAKGKTLGGMFEESINKMMGSDDLTRKFKYSPTTDAKLRKMMDESPGFQDGIFRIGTEVDDFDSLGNKIGTKILTFDDVILDNLEAIRTIMPDIKPRNPKGRVSATDALMEKVEKVLKEASDSSILSGDASRVLDSDELAFEMERLSPAIEEIRTLINDKKAFSKGLTGIDWYDSPAAKLSEKIKNIKRKGQIRTDKVDEVDKWIKEQLDAGKITAADVASETFRAKYLLPNQTDGQRTLEWLEGFDNIFKLSKVAMGTASILNAYVGNPFMYKALGGKLNPEYFKEVYRAFKLQFGQASQFDLFDMFFSSDEMTEFLIRRNPTTRSYLGIKFEELKAKFLSKAIEEGSLSAELLGKSKARINDAIAEKVAEARTLFKKYKDDLERAAMESAGSKTKLKNTIKTSIPFTSENLSKAKFGSDAQNIAFDMPSGPYADLALGDNPFTRFMDKVSSDAKNGDIVAKGFNFLLNEYPKVFQASDVSSKIGTLLHTFKNGLDIDELRAIGKVVGIDTRKVSEGGDILEEVVRQGETYYRIAPDKGMEIAQEAYMNYAAMPSFVKMMKSVPILRSPFFSFSYAMLPKFGKALVHNPAFFNQVSFAEKELSAEKGPIERENLKSKYYNWFDAPGIVKLPEFSFFRDNPAYLNLTSMNPFESMSITGESARVYGDGVLDQLVALSDKAGLFQHPVFRTLLDFLIIPSIQGKKVPVQGSFGQPLYQLNATKAEKAKRIALAIADAYTPSVLAAPIAGAALGLETVLPDKYGRELGQSLPLYFSRSIYHAGRGETPLGIDSKNASMIRSLLSAFGLRTNTMDLSFTPKEIKDKINNK